MNYVLMPLTEVDFNKIMKDSGGGNLALNQLSQRPTPFSHRTWVLDISNDSYLFSHDADRAGYCYYIFFYKKRMYEVRLDPGIFESERILKFTCGEPDLDIYAEVKEGLIAAFAVYGAWGHGDEDGASALIPIFS